MRVRDAHNGGRVELAVERRGAAACAHRCAVRECVIDERLDALALAGEAHCADIDARVTGRVERWSLSELYGDRRDALAEGVVEAVVGEVWAEGRRMGREKTQRRRGPCDKCGGTRGGGE